MPSLVSRARAFRSTDHFKRLWKYASVSIISTAVTQVVLFSTYHVFRVGTAIECNILATACASVPAYYLNRNWTWGKSGRSNIWREVVPFWSISFVGLVLSTVAVGVAAHNADRISHGSLDRAIIVNGANLVTYAFIWTGRYMIFNRFLFGDRAGQPVSMPETASTSSSTSLPIPEQGPASVTRPAEAELGSAEHTSREAADPAR
jgi:putative flippase GtrA